MNKIVSSIMLLGMLTASSVFATTSEKTLMEKNEVRTDTKAVVNTNIEYAEGRLMKKIRAEESRLQKYQSNLENSENGEEVKHWMKKMKSSERKLKNLNDTLIGIELIKARSSGY